MTRSHNSGKPGAKRHMETTAESELVRSARAGDVAAFEALYRAYNDRIYNFAKHVTGSAEDAGDVTQETFVRAWSSLPKLREDGTFSVWLHRIALNRCRDVLKKHRREGTVSLDCPVTDAEGEEMPMQLESDLPGPEEAAFASEKQSAVRRAVESLSEGHRLVVTMHHMEGLDVESVAKILNVPRGTVMSRLSRAREALRRKLSGYIEVHDDEHKE